MFNHKNLFDINKFYNFQEKLLWNVKNYNNEIKTEQKNTEIADNTHLATFWS